MPEYTIRIFASKMPVPIQFTYHTWVVAEHGGQQDRFDVFGFIKDGRGSRCGHLYENYHPCFRGVPVFSIGSRHFFRDKFEWPSKEVFTITGNKDSDAEKIFTLLHNLSGECSAPFWEGRYNLLLGPNSNTFTQWVLDSVAPGKYNLPWRAVGKDALRKKTTLI